MESFKLIIHFKSIAKDVYYSCGAKTGIFSLNPREVTCDDCRKGVNNHVLLPLSDIKVGANRSRIISDINPLDPEFRALIDSIRDDGVFNAPVIDKDNNLLQGNRRYAAMMLLYGDKHVTSFRVVEKPTGDEVESDIVSMLENIIRQNPSNADYAHCFAALKDKLVKEKGQPPKTAIAYIAVRIGWTTQRVNALIRIKERLTPRMFEAFRGVGGIALTLAEASAYATLPVEEQDEAWRSWRALRGRKGPPEDDAPVRPAHPHQSIERVRELLGQFRPESKWTWLRYGAPLSTEARTAIEATLKWMLSDAKDFPFKKEE